MYRNRSALLSRRGALFLPTSSLASPSLPSTHFLCRRTAPSAATVSASTTTTAGLISSAVSCRNQLRFCSSGGVSTSTSSASAASAAPLNGMAFAAPSSSSSSSPNALLPLDYNVTAWYHPQVFDMVVAYNVLQQLAKKNGGVKLTCSFPTLPSIYMHSGASSGAAPLPFVSSPLLSHVEFLCVSITTPIAQLFADHQASASKKKAAAAAAAASSTSGGGGGESSSPRSFLHLSSGSSDPSSTACSIPLTSFAGSPAPVGSEPMSFVIFQDGTIVGWNAPWSEMLSMRNLLSLKMEDVNAEVARIAGGSSSTHLPSSAGSSLSSSSSAAAAASTSNAATEAKAAGQALQNILFDNSTNAATVTGRRSHSSSRKAGASDAAVGDSAAPPRTSVDSVHGVVTISGISSPSSLSLTSTDVHTSSSAASSSAAEFSSSTVEMMHINGSGNGLTSRVWRGIDNFTSLFSSPSPSSWFGLRGGGGISAARTSPGAAGGGYLQDKVSHALSSAAFSQHQPSSSSSSSAPSSHHLSSAALPSFYAISSGIDTMRFSYFDRYPNASSASLERREQLEESGDWVQGSDYYEFPSSSSASASQQRCCANPANGAASSVVAVARTTPVVVTAVADGSEASAQPQPPQQQHSKIPLSMRNFVDADKDFIVLADDRDHFKIPFSYALAQSVKLDAIDHSIAPISAAVKGWQQKLAATGKLSCGVRALRKTKTRLLSLVEALNFKNNIQTTPKVFWSGELQFVRNGYKDACEHLEIEDRRELLQGKMDTVDESLSYLHDEDHANTMEFLTWVIIYLIAFEIAVAFGALHALSTLWGFMVGLVW